MAGAGLNPSEDIYPGIIFVDHKICDSATVRISVDLLSVFRWGMECDLEIALSRQHYPGKPQSFPSLLLGDETGALAGEYLGCVGSHPNWTAKFRISPLPADDTHLTFAWPEANLDPMHWTLSRNVIEVGLRAAAELQSLATGAVENDEDFADRLIALAKVAARTSDLGAELAVPRPKMSMTPVASIGLPNGTVEVHPVSPRDLESITSALAGQTIHVITAEGAINVTVIAMGDAADVARALATSLASKGDGDERHRAPHA